MDPDWVSEWCRFHLFIRGQHRGYRDWVRHRRFHRARFAFRGTNTHSKAREVQVSGLHGSESHTPRRGTGPADLQRTVNHRPLATLGYPDREISPEHVIAAPSLDANLDPVTHCDHSLGNGDLERWVDSSRHRNKGEQQRNHGHRDADTVNGHGDVPSL